MINRIYFILLFFFFHALALTALAEEFVHFNWGEHKIDTFLYEKRKRKTRIGIDETQMTIYLQKLDTIRTLRTYVTIKGNVREEFKMLRMGRSKIMKEYKKEKFYKKLQPFFQDHYLQPGFAFYELTLESTDKTFKERIKKGELRIATSEEMKGFSHYDELRQYAKKIRYAKDILTEQDAKKMLSHKIDVMFLQLRTDRNGQVVHWRILSDISVAKVISEKSLIQINNYIKTLKFKPHPQLGQGYSEHMPCIPIYSRECRHDEWDYGNPRTRPHWYISHARLVNYLKEIFDANGY